MDEYFGRIKDKKKLYEDILEIKGVVENGILIEMESEEIIEGKEGIRKMKRY